MNATIEPICAPIAMAWWRYLDNREFGNLGKISPRVSEKMHLKMLPKFKLSRLRKPRLKNLHELQNLSAKALKLSNCACFLDFFESKLI